MADKKRTAADGAAFAALFIVALAVNICLAVFTDVEVILRWGITAVAGIVAAATAYAIVSRRSRSRS
ncbi:hypothetical protein SAMN05216488_2704 [Microbacterium sp. LKL04]|uniref:Uncharacterized protein n=1 Tax=Microbacterium oleivorans TaxID=273677 RepID=A0A4R5YKT9_9MICO|nr:hypothetical protein [Microbacterium]MDQ1126258.1 hypothetical protein [Microbacterium sp. SORGH_AS_0505]TDL45619.1 hypothetical protein E2R54_03965 [Microbacterium oleivorans]SCY64329.1 hypothetical protein SAMN05216488_2704 [Microbacterium sp. LKL04]